MIAAARKMLSPVQYSEQRTRIIVASRCAILLVSIVVNFYCKLHEKVLNNSSR